MLTHTFCHAPGVGTGTERRLWEAGVLCWDDAEVRDLGRRTGHIRDTLRLSRSALAAGDPRFFARVLPSREQWRLFAPFRGRVAYLDIETTGLSEFDEVTCIALWDGTSVRHYVQGRNLERFELDVFDYDLLVTFNGKGFDVPMIRRILRVELNHAHIDLMHVLRSLDQRGGLKAIERRMGLARTDLADVDGYFAVILWEAWRRTRDEAVLETLLAYNAQDVLTLEPLMVWAYNEKLRQTPFPELALAPAPLAPNPYRAHRTVIDRLRRADVA